MGNANCCHQQADKDLFVGHDMGKQRNYYDEVDQQSTVERFGEDLRPFQEDQQFRSSTFGSKWYKHKEQDKYYMGHWDDEQMTGEGIIYAPEKYAYYGHFDEVPNGRGKLISYKHDLVYEGQIERGRVQGQGKVKHTKGWYEFEGKMADGRPVKGELSVFDPETKEKKFTARFSEEQEEPPTVDYVDGKFYRGQLDGRTFLPDGFGTMTYPDYSKYQGNWKQGLFHGKGNFEWQNGYQYEGEYEQGLKHGSGKFTYPNKSYYEGGWERGKMHGDGLMRDENGQIQKEGRWREGQFEN